MIDFTKMNQIGTYLLNNELTWGNSGNLSARVNEKSMVITASGTKLGELKDEDWVSVDIHSGEWQGARKPSKEVPMHTAIYQERPDINVVIHASPFYSTLIACSNEDVISELFIESMYYLEDVSFVEYHHPGSQALGDAVKQKALADVIMLKNHGVIVYDESIAEAITRLETLEFACKMIVTAKASNIPLNKLDAPIVHDFLHHSGYKPRKKTV